MYRFTIVAVAMMTVAPVLALADEPAKDAAVMTKGECMEMNGALRALDGYDYVVNAGKPDEKVVHRAYKMGDSRVTVALNLSALKPVGEAFQAAQQALVAEIGNGESINQHKKNPKGEQDASLGETDEWKVYAKRYEALLKEPCNVTLGRIKAGDFKANDDNPIPVSVLSVIGKITDK